MVLQAITKPGERDSGPGTLNRLDAVWLVGVVALMGIYTYAHSAHRIFWGDEIMGWLVMRAKTFSGSMHELRAGIDSSGLLFTILGRWWMELVGPSEMSLRVLSAAMCAGAFVIFWICARRFYSITAVGLSLPLAFFANQEFNWQLANGRTYGLLLLAIALASYAMLEADPLLPLKKSTLALVFFAHFMLVGSHILGPLFSGIFIAGLVGQDLWARQFRPQLYLSALAGWVVLVVSFKEIQTTAALGKPIFWTPKPHLKDLAVGAAAFSTPLFCIMVAAAFIAVCATRFRPEAVPAETPAIRRTPLYFLLATFAGIYLVSLGISLVTTSIFYNRYMLPLLFADGLILCELVHRTGRTLPRHSPQRCAAIAAGILLLAGIYQRHYVYVYHFPESDFTPEIVAKAAGRPIVLADAAVFTQMAFYHNGQATLATPIDWSIITDPKAGALLTSGTHEMENWKRDGFYSADILTTPEILGRFPDFLLVSNPSAPFWYRKYVASNPNYDVKPLGMLHDDNLYLVHMRGTFPLAETDGAGFRTR